MAIKTDFEIVQNATPDSFRNLQDQIQATYDMVFANNENFRQYFFATADLTPDDALVRLGVFIKRLHEEPSESFNLMRKIYRNTKLSETSLQNLDNAGGFGQAIALNGYTQSQIRSWKEDQPREEEQFLQMIESLVRKKLHLPAPDGAERAKIIYSFPRIHIPSEQIKEVLDIILPESSIVDVHNYGEDRDCHFDIETPLLKFSVHLWNHKEFGDYFAITFPDFFSDCPINTEDEGIQNCFQEYYTDCVVPVLLLNSIESLRPDLVLDSLKSTSTGRRIFESMFLTPGIFRDCVPKDQQNIKHYFLGGRSIDLKFIYAQKLGLFPKEMYWSEYSFMGGWFLNVEQLWHTLFNCPYPGNIEVLQEVDNVNKAIQLRSTEMSPTHQKVISYIISDLGDREVEDFVERAQSVQESYRVFCKNDLSKFTFPGGYRPIAVEKEEIYAIGFKEVEGGVELCFQVSNQAIVLQIESEIISHNKSITDHQLSIEELETLKQKYQPE